MPGYSKPLPQYVIDNPIDFLNELHKPITGKLNFDSTELNPLKRTIEDDMEMIRHNQYLDFKEEQIQKEIDRLILREQLQLVIENHKKTEDEFNTMFKLLFSHNYNEFEKAVYDVFFSEWGIKFFSIEELEKLLLDNESVVIEKWMELIDIRDNLSFSFSDSKKAELCEELQQYM